MKSALKYIICIVVVILVTSTVMFMPYLYYSAEDSKNSDSYTIDDFSLSKFESYINSEDVINLITSEDAIWLYSEETAYADMVNQKIDTKNEYAIYADIVSALEDIQKYMVSSEYEKNLFDTILNNDICEIYNIDNYVTTIVSGIVDGKSISVSLDIVTFVSDNPESLSLSLTVIFDRRTNKIYALDIFSSNSSFYDEETEEILEEMLSQFHTDSDYYEYIDEVSKEIKDYVYNDLLKYWNLNSYVGIEVFAYNDQFSFYVIKEEKSNAQVELE